jgi:VanZ family protein
MRNRNQWRQQRENLTCFWLFGLTFCDAEHFHQLFLSSVELSLSDVVFAATQKHGGQALCSRMHIKNL